MRVYCYVLFGAFVFSILTSCTTIYGDKNLVKQEKTKMLIPHKVTKEDVYKVIGQPADVISQGEGYSSWVFRYREAKPDMVSYVPLFGIGTLAGGRNGELHTGVFDFNQKNMLISKRINPEQLYTSNFFSIGRSLRSSMSTSESQKRVKAEMDSLEKAFDKSRADEYYILELAVEK